MTRTLIRRGWVIPLIAVAVAAIAYLIATSQSRTYTSDATLVVPSVPETAGPQNTSNATDLVRTPSDATDLAKTYAAQIPEDDQVVGQIAKGLHASSRGVRDSLQAAAVTGTDPGSETALVTISYGAGSPGKARAGARLASAAVTGAHPAATGITPGSLELIRAPDDGSSSSLGTTAITIGGAIVGLALALLLLLTWERADRRIDRPEDLAEEANCPATRLRDLSDDARGALLRRWGDWSSGGPAEVALMAVDGRTLRRLSPSHLRPLVPQRSDATNGLGNGNGHKDSLPPRIRLDGRVVLTTPLSPADDPAGQETAMEADVAILVARRGTPAARVRKTVRSLDEMGASPRWALLLG